MFGLTLDRTECAAEVGCDSCWGASDSTVRVNLQTVFAPEAAGYLTTGIGGECELEGS